VPRRIREAADAVRLISREIPHRLLWESAACRSPIERPLAWPNFLYLRDGSRVPGTVLFMELLLIREDADFTFIASIYNISVRPGCSSSRPSPTLSFVFGFEDSVFQLQDQKQVSVLDRCFMLAKKTPWPESESERYRPSGTFTFPSK
jgi:hypothetical protein